MEIIMKRSDIITVFGIILLTVFLCSCTASETKGLSDEQSVFRAIAADVHISTASDYKTSFRQAVGEDMEVIYLGKPRKLDNKQQSDCEWTSSDDTVAYVRNGIVTGLKEGVVTIFQKRDNKTTGEWTFAVTTFNDGRQPEFSYCLEKEDFDELLWGEHGAPTPEYLRDNINTIHDVITYIHSCGFSRSVDMPIHSNEVTDWYWSTPGSSVILENQGITEDLTSMAGYLLENDFEDWGYIANFGYNLKILNWFYEDGFYYVFDFAKVLSDIRNDIHDASYEIYKTDNLDDLGTYVSGIIDTERTIVSVMFSANGHSYPPAYGFSYMHDSSQIYYEHSRIMLEDIVLDNSRILFTNPAFDYEIVGVPASEMPDNLPLYSENCRYGYE